MKSLKRRIGHVFPIYSAQQANAQRKANDALEAVPGCEDGVEEGNGQEVTGMITKAARYIGIPVALALLLLSGGFWAS